MTPGFDLPARHVIHTVGPVWHGGSEGEPKQLASCYRACMRLAADRGLESIAFPAISCGVFHYPPQEAAAIAVETIVRELDSAPGVEEVILVAFDRTMVQILEDAIGRA